MLEELKRKNKEYIKGTEKIHSLDEYKELINKEIGSLGRSYEDLYEVYKNLGGETLSFPLRTYRKHKEDNYLTPDFFMSEDKLITNEKTRYQNFFKQLKNELQSCTEFLLMVSFIKNSGVQLILRELDYLETMGIKGKIITSTYLNITDSKALYKLSKYKNIEIKIYNEDKESFHTKAYIFKRDNNLGSLIIGSSNLSHSALCSGKEWNIRLAQGKNQNIYKNSISEFDKVWNSDKNYILTNKFIEAYRLHKEKYKDIDFNKFSFSDKNFTKEIEPNVMQTNILYNLQSLRNQEKNKALVIAATGTGKTYLSAFDVRNFKAKRVLFLAHRDELLTNAKETYSKVFPNVSLGKISMTEKTYLSDFIFATVQSMQKENVLLKFEKNSFDYIVIDEFHHAAADTYTKIINYFSPKFLLGLTATPERMDGRDILHLTDYNIAGEIRLRDALELDLLTPFHYFGISDKMIDYDNIKIKQGKFDINDLSKKLSINKRVNFIIEKIQHYGYGEDRLKALGFCVDINHAIYMSAEFNKKNIKSAYITAKDSQHRRKEILSKFRNGEIEVLFSIDIFNEGIDIPEVNMLLFLRPTNSSTIFIQQLGRGLRKIKDKEYVTVLDFIGNYNRVYVLEEAFINKNINKLDKEVLIREVKNEFHSIPGSSFIELDRICQKQILDNIENIKLNSSSTLTNLYSQVIDSLGRSPRLIDFLYSTDIDPTLFINYFGSFIETKKRMKDLNSSEENFTSEQVDLLARLESKLPIKWSFEYLLMHLLLDNKETTIEGLITYAKSFFNGKFKADFHKNIIKYSLQEMSKEEKKWIFPLIEIVNDKISLSKWVREKVEDNSFKLYIKDLFLYGLYRYKNEFIPKINSDNKLVLYQKYSRNELQHLLLSSAQKGSWRAGYSIANKDLCLFITLNKDKNTEKHLMYDNFFQGQDIVQWISQNKTSHSSPIGQLYLNHNKMGYDVHLFIRKYSIFGTSAMSFTYFGKVNYYNSHGDKPMYILWKLKNKIPESIYLDLID